MSEEKIAHFESGRRPAPGEVLASSEAAELAIMLGKDPWHFEQAIAHDRQNAIKVHGCTTVITAGHDWVNTLPASPLLTAEVRALLHEHVPPLPPPKPKP